MLKSKIIIVTGGNGLLGKAVVKYLQREGAKVIIAEVGVVTNKEAGIYECDITDNVSVNTFLRSVYQTSQRYL